MKYICKKCGVVSDAKDENEIFRFKKLCDKCLSEHNASILKRDVKITKINKSLKRKKNIRNKEYVCNTCGRVYADKPYICEEPCHSKSFAIRSRTDVERMNDV